MVFDSTLSFEQQLFLAIYQLFFRQRYSSDGKDKAMQMMYLLSLSAMDLPKYEFSMQEYPYSAAFYLFLTQLDRKVLDIDRFYNNVELRNKVLADYKAKILEMRQSLKILEHADDFVSWLGLLSTIAYVSHVQLPHAGDDLVRESALLKLHSSYAVENYSDAFNCVSSFR